MASENMVIVELTWTQARALAYASHKGLNSEGWPSEYYRTEAREARNAVLLATAKLETVTERAETHI